ncbi:FMN-binding protein [Microlunatus aurantiacus]|uniref:FMN-binding protein n=1 Tax=Microlunatus aurantiacus TaxID=446786 RepID=A0ABP7DLP2_9ACTN
MKRIVLWLASTVTVVVLLFGYHTSTNSPAATSASSQTSATSTGSGAGSAAPPDPSSEPTDPSSEPTDPSSQPTAAGSSAAQTYQGSTVQTRWGPVQVQITVKSGRITAVDVLQHPSENPKDAEINDYALPVLVQDTLKAQSAKIDMVSGATVTSDGYVQSLQSALDKAGL